MVRKYFLYRMLFPIRERIASAVWKGEHEEGSMTVTMALICAACASIICVLVVAVQVVIEGHVAQSSADLSALSAGQAYYGMINTSDSPCQVATVIASRNGSTLTECHFDGVNYRVSVKRPVVAHQDLLYVTRHASAGPYISAQ